MAQRIFKLAALPVAICASLAFSVPADAAKITLPNGRVVDTDPAVTSREKLNEIKLESLKELQAAVQNAGKVKTEQARVTAAAWLEALKQLHPVGPNGSKTDTSARSTAPALANNANSSTPKPYLPPMSPASARPTPTTLANNASNSTPKPYIPPMSPASARPTPTILANVPSPSSSRSRSASVPNITVTTPPEPEPSADSDSNSSPDGLRSPRWKYMERAAAARAAAKAAKKKAAVQRQNAIRPAATVSPAPTGASLT